MHACKVHLLPFLCLSADNTCELGILMLAYLLLTKYYLLVLFALFPTALFSLLFSLLITSHLTAHEETRQSLGSGSCSLLSVLANISTMETD